MWNRFPPENRIKQSLELWNLHRIIRCVRKVATSNYKLRHVCLPVYPSAKKKKKLGFHWTDFHEILHLTIFRTSVKKIKVLLKSDHNNGYFTWGPIYIYDNISLNLFANEKCERQKLHRKSKDILSWIPYFRISCRGKIWYSQTDHRWQYNTAHALCMIDN